MDIRNTKQLTQFAAERVDNTPAVRRIALIYCSLSLGLALLVTVVNYVLGLQMDNLGGLSNLGKKSILSTVQTVLPLVQSMISLCLNVGFMAAMLRVARGQYVSEQTLRLGLDRFWVLLRLTLFRTVLLASVIMVSIYLGIMLFMMTPLSNEVAQFLLPYLEDVTLLSSAVVMDDTAYAQFASMLWPAYLICFVLMGIIGLPMLYAYRMAEYVVIDKPAVGALAALRESKQMMRRNRMKLAKLDLQLWWYYLPLALAMAVGYGDVLLPMVGVELPLSPQISYFLFYGVYLAASFAVYFFLLPRAETTYALAYDGLRPKEQKADGVVLGNIFQMR